MRGQLKFSEALSTVQAAVGTVDFTSNNLQLLGISRKEPYTYVDFEWTNTGTVSDVQGSMLAIAFPGAVSIAGACSITGAASVTGNVGIAGEVTAATAVVFPSLDSSEGTIAGRLYTASEVVKVATV